MSRIAPVATSQICLTEGDSVVIATITTTGASTTTWTVAPSPTGADRSVALIADTLVSLTALTVDLEASSDNGTTWNKYAIGVVVIGATANPVVKNVVPGLIYRVNATTVTGTSCKLCATVS